MRLFAIILLAAWLQAAEVPDGITVTPAAVSFTYLIGGALPAEQKVQIKRTGTGAALDYTAAVSGAPWLILTPASGKTGTTMGVRVNPTSLLAGTHSAQVQITATGMTAPVTLTVTVSVKNPPATAAAEPATLSLNFQTDQAAPAPSTISVTSSGEPISFTAAASGGAWLSVAPNLGIAVAGRPVELTVTLNTTGLVPASYTGKVTLAFTNAANKSLVVPVSLTVTPGVAVVDSIWPNSAPVGSLDTTITLRGAHLFQNSVVQAGTTTLTTTWISTGVMLAVVPRALLANQGTLAVTVTNAQQTASQPVTFTVTPPGPRIEAVMNAASFAKPATPVIAPGEIISIFGSGLGPSTLLPATVSNGAYPTTLGSPATTVEFELTANTWTAAPLIFVQANQINAVAPMAMTAATGLRMRVTYNGIASTPLTFDAVDADPGLFTTDSSGRGQAAVLNYNETTKVYSLNSAANPAPKGTIVCLYMTGGGIFNPAVQDGRVISTTGAAPQLAVTPSVSIAGEGASVQAAAAVPGSVGGLVQVNVSVPTTVAAGKNLPVVVTVSGRSSPATATIAVK
ncbi:MAG: IPT/TIG domain-containing protein [Bryobacteraceae bacterium]